MKSKTRDVSAIILAGGRSSRFGPDKTLVCINGKTLLENVIENLETHFGDIIISISAGSNHNTRHFNHHTVVDEQADCGPLMGILSALRTSRTPVNFICACDIPEIDMRFIEKMMAFTSGYEIVVPRTGNNFFEPLFGFYHLSLTGRMESFLQRKGRKVNRFLDECATKYLYLEENNWYRNLNTVSDFRAYRDRKNTGKRQSA
jgi:molybdopterin-guanine dinucleotide biosynthesis protein A